MTKASNIAELNRELAQRCKAAELPFDCGGDGSFNAEIAIIGEFPNQREQELRLPISGNAGKYLWDNLRKYNISRRICYVTNAIKRRAFVGEEGDGKFSKAELGQWHGLLNWELSHLPNLKYILVLGEQALDAVTGKTGITFWRGSVINQELSSVVFGDDGIPKKETRQVTVFAANNPARVFREPLTEIMFKFDMDRFNSVVTGSFTPHHLEEIINPSYKEAIDWLNKMEADNKPIATDIEVISMETACIGFANDPHIGMCINFRDAKTNRYTLQEEADIRIRIQQLYANPKMKFVAQNGSFDSYWLWYKDRIRIPKIWFDTLLAHHTLYPPLPHSLAFLTSQYTNHPYYKDDGKTWKEGGDIDQFWRYNVKDCCITLAVHEKEAQELVGEKLDRFFFNHVMRLQPHLVHMTVHGVLCDAGLKETIAARMSEDVSGLLAKFHQAAQVAVNDPEYKPNPNSPKQMKELYFDKLKLIGRGVSTNAENRERMIKHHKTSPEAAEVLRAQSKYAEENKFFTTYAQMVVDEDNRIRCDWKQYGVVSAPGRLSSTATMWDSGMNLQNQPERARQMFVADDGYCFVYFDLAQVEARIVGWLAPIPRWMEQFEKARLVGGYDAHRALASDMFNIPYDEVPAEDTDEYGNKTLRFTAKRCRHGLNYRMAADRLAQTTGMSMRDAERNYTLYHRVNPEIKEWWDNTIAEVKKNRCLWSPKGRRWVLLERYDEEALKSVVAFKPQSTAGDHVAEVIYKCHEDPDWPKQDEYHLDARVVMNIHDALIALCKVDDHKKVMKIMKKHAEAPIMINGTPLIVPADFAVSQPDERGIHRWSTLKKIKKFDEYVST